MTFNGIFCIYFNSYNTSILWNIILQKFLLRTAKKRTGKYFSHLSRINYAYINNCTVICTKIELRWRRKGKMASGDANTKTKWSLTGSSAWRETAPRRSPGSSATASHRWPATAHRPSRSSAANNQTNNERL